MTATAPSSQAGPSNFQCYQGEAEGSSHTMGYQQHSQSGSQYPQGGYYDLPPQQPFYPQQSSQGGSYGYQAATQGSAGPSHISSGPSALDDDMYNILPEDRDQSRARSSHTGDRASSVAHPSRTEGQVTGGGPLDSLDRPNMAGYGARSQIDGSAMNPSSGGSGQAVFSDGGTAPSQSAQGSFTYYQG